MLVFLVCVWGGLVKNGGGCWSVGSRKGERHALLTANPSLPLVCLPFLLLPVTFLDVISLNSTFKWHGGSIPHEMLRGNILIPHHKVLLGGGVPSRRKLAWCFGVPVTFLIHLCRLPGQTSLNLNFFRQSVSRSSSSFLLSMSQRYSVTSSKMISISRWKERE